MMDTTSKVRILIVEDEILLAKDIQNRLEDCNYEIVGIAPSVDKALILISNIVEIDIILLDITLKGDKDGIDLAEIINEKYDIPFIFLTSHAEGPMVDRAKAAKPYAYILKPFNDRQVSIAIDVALESFYHKTPGKDIQQSQKVAENNNQVLQIKDSLFLKKDHHFERVPIKEILYLQADSNYCTVYTKSERFIYSMVLKKIEAQLPESQFLRTHRSYVVNIQSVNGYEGNMLFIGKQKVPVSKTYKEDVFRLFRTL